ncbi:Helix-turn-helix domain-containing protein [Tessaracoccus bendigoensis DSM 12906]|uniref:Helix-turn-helix domain-containing protein n=1 Tax=Tessaracoccus bendigoensis DSM 12906 TaxID=1123357 RepID=A0A1M6L3G7_9ACTN|nr:helix-turn-helix transcriptional regulator [Tessaracoccus bendigoensis]SHJ65765.1 Helix-turn-helix domain-containing protein [Tessaracoccus bendigoensis DSM 12906]
MEHQAEVTDFLKSRRDRITPEQAGIIGGGRRRVPGLRREEVAMLTGVSVEYYARMERGDLAGVSLEVLDAMARALQLNQAEFDHLRDLARAAGPRPPRRRRSSPTGRVVRPELQRFLDAVTGVPMWVRDRRLDFIAANPLGRALYAPMLDDPANGGNSARFTFLNPAARVFFPDWEDNADTVVATLRMYAGRYPLDERLTDLIDELNRQSDAFRNRWSEHEVAHHRSGLKRINHPEVGLLEFSYQAMNLPANPDWYVFAFTAEAGSPTEERLRLLASLQATARPKDVDVANR